jgi:hypothetical protein
MKLIMVDDDGDAIPLDPAVVGDGTTARMLEIFSRCIALQRKKALTYGNAWREQGYMGNVARVLSKASRIKNMVWGDVFSNLDDTDESVTDTLHDLINISCFFIINKQDRNRWGS